MKLELGIDGQCDSPGHNATVTAIDAITNKVVDVVVFIYLVRSITKLVWLHSYD